LGPLGMRSNHPVCQDVGYHGEKIRREAGQEARISN
jgi:hypothetical protein